MRRTFKFPNEFDQEKGLNLIRESFSADINQANKEVYINYNKNIKNSRMIPLSMTCLLPDLIITIMKINKIRKGHLAMA